MEVLAKLLKAITDFFSNSNVLLKFLDSFNKSKKKAVLLLIASAMVLMAIIYFYCFVDNTSSELVIAALFIYSALMLVFAIVICISKNRSLEKLSEKHEHEMLMTKEEYKADLSVRDDRHKRELSTLSFNYKSTRMSIISLYYTLHRGFRNTINTIEKYHKEDTKTTDDILKQTENISVPVIRFTQDLLDCLTDIFTQLTGEKVCACVKIMVDKDFNRVDYNDAYVRTFLRSRNTSQDRMSYHDAHPHDVKLCDNTDFMEVVSAERLNKSSCFYQGNLEEYDKGLRKFNLEYRNTTKDYISFYKGTIVAPIRIANQYIFYTDREEGYNTIGFLCIDSESTAAFPLECEKEYTDIMRSFAAILYNVLSKYQFYLAEQERRSRELKESTNQKRSRYTPWNPRI